MYVASALDFLYNIYGEIQYDEGKDCYYYSVSISSGNILAILNQIDWSYLLYLGFMVNSIKQDLTKEKVS